MKCFTSIVLLAITSIATVFARKEVGKYKSGFDYILYDDGQAAIVGTYYDSMRDASVPQFIVANRKQYLVTEIAAKAFYGKEINKFTIDGYNSILIKKNAFSGVKGLKEFHIINKNVDVEIGGFSGVGTLVQFQGEGIPNTVNRYCEKLLKQWNLPVGMNYNYVDDKVKKQDLFTLGKNMQSTFGIYDKIAYPDNAANVAFIGSGSSNGLSRLYRIMAIVMGISYEDVLTGCDNMHYCWNYVKVNGYNENTKKWHVYDIQDPIYKTTVFDNSSFQKERTFLNTLKRYYGNTTTIDPHKFIVLNNRYNYPYEDRVTNFNTENFDDWLKRTNGGVRTL